MAKFNYKVMVNIVVYWLFCKKWLLNNQLLCNSHQKIAWFYHNPVMKYGQNQHVLYCLAIELPYLSPDVTVDQTGSGLT